MAQKPKAVDLSGFDSLPDNARAPLPVVCALYSVSDETVRRRVKAGLIPAPIKEGGSTRWIVGDLRKALCVSGSQGAKR